MARSKKYKITKEIQDRLDERKYDNEIQYTNKKFSLREFINKKYEQ